MKSLALRSLVLLLCGVAVGLAVGYRLALFREHQRLERNKELVRSMEDKVFSEKNIDAAMKVAREIYTSDFLVHDWLGDHKGMDALAEGLRYTQADFLDWKESAVSIVAEGDYVAARLISGGTQARDFGAVPHISPAIPNKHRSLRLQEMVIFRVEDGKLAEQWAINDGWDASIELGLFDPDHWKESVCGEIKKP
ncbi:MAG: ester cyclase [Candidatus Sulfotelmatobacter sp.]